MRIPDYASSWLRRFPRSVAIALQVLLLLSGGALLQGAESPAKALIEKGSALYKEKKFDEAIVVYNEALALDPKNARVYMFRGLTQSFKGNWKECVEDMNRAIEIDATDQELLTTRAYAYIHTGEFELAKKDFRAIDALEKGAGQKAQVSMAQNFLRRARQQGMTQGGDRKKALADYNRVLGFMPPNDMLLYERACTLIELKDFPAALIDLDEVIKIDGQIAKYGDPHMQRAKVRRLLKDEKGAKADEEEVARRAPK